MNQPARKPKPKKCKVCRTEFSPARPLQSACSVPCALEVVKAKKAKEHRQIERKEKAERLDARRRLKTKSEWLRECQAVVNQYVRLRDRDLPCISCQRHHEGKYDAGHFRTVKACPELRFETLQIWKQCVPCNQYLSGNLIEYRKELVRRIGLEKVEWLEGPHEPKRYSIEDLKAIKEEYRAKVRELKKGEA